MKLLCLCKGRQVQGANCTWLIIILVMPMHGFYWTSMCNHDLRRVTFPLIPMPTTCTPPVSVWWLALPGLPHNLTGSLVLSTCVLAAIIL